MTLASAVAVESQSQSQSTSAPRCSLYCCWLFISHSSSCQLILFVIVVVAAAVAAAVRMPSCSAITCEVVLLFVLIIKMAGLHFPVVGRPTHSRLLPCCHAAMLHVPCRCRKSQHAGSARHWQPTSLAARMTHKRTAKCGKMFNLEFMSN